MEKKMNFAGLRVKYNYNKEYEAAGIIEKVDEKERMAFVTVGIAIKRKYVRQSKANIHFFNSKWVKFEDIIEVFK